VEARIRSMPGRFRVDRSPNEPRTGSSQTRVADSNSLAKIPVEL
jgi:hypothetical protein